MTTPSKNKKPPEAGGLPSVQSTVKHLLQSNRVRVNVKNLLKANKAGGFDCPGCAWGDSPQGHIQFCENGAKAIAWESTDKMVDADFFRQHSVNQLQEQSDFWLESQGRLIEPMRYNARTDHYERVSWDDAFALIANTLNSLSNANEVEFYTSGRASNEAAFLYQLFGRSFGTNNFPDCSNMCHEASGIALNQSIGVGKGTVVLDDFYQADVIFVFGQNPGSNHPRMLNALKRAAKNGCKIVTVNNLKEIALEKFASPQDPLELLTPKSTSISSLYLSPKLGGDMALIRGIIKAILESRPDSISMDFIAQHTYDFDAFKQSIKQTSWQEIEKLSGVLRYKIEDAADIFSGARNVITCWAMGLTQHQHSVITIQEIVNLHLMTGQIGRPGAGLCPVRGHSNVQGNRTVGINEQPSFDFINRLEQITNKPLPKAPGHNVHFAIKALHEKSSKVLVSLGGNLAAAGPDSAFTQKAISNAELNVQISTKLNRTHLMVSQDALILPCLGRTEIDMQKSGEQRITVEDTFSMVHASAGKTLPLSQLCLSETEIIARMAHTTFGQSNIDWLKLIEDYSRIREMIAQTIDGFEDFNEKIKRPGGFHLYNPAANNEWKTVKGKAIFSVAELPLPLLRDKKANENSFSRDNQFVLQTLRSHDQYNTTIYGMDDRYRGVINKRNVIFINSADAAKLSLKSGEKVDIESRSKDGVIRKVHRFELVFYDIPEGNLAGYYPELNPLVSIDSYGHFSYTPTSKSIVVSLKVS